MSPTATAARTATTSATTAASNRFMAEHLAEATALGEQLADLVHDPGSFVAAVKQGFETLADPVYADGSRSIAPGLGPVLGVRLPLMEATTRPSSVARARLRHRSSST